MIQGQDGIGALRLEPYNLPVKRGPVRPGVRLFSSEYSGRFRQIWSPFGTLFGEEFGEATTLRPSRRVVDEKHNFQCLFGENLAKLLTTIRLVTSIQQVAEWLIWPPTVSGNLVEDRTHKRFIQNHRHSDGTSPSRIRAAHRCLPSCFSRDTGSQSEVAGNVLGNNYSTINCLHLQENSDGFSCRLGG